MNVLMLVDLISTYTNVIGLYKSNSVLLGLLKGNIDLLNILILDVIELGTNLITKMILLCNDVPSNACVRLLCYYIIY